MSQRVLFFVCEPANLRCFALDPFRVMTIRRVFYLSFQLLRGRALGCFQEMHGKAAETQVFISTDRIANIYIRRVALLVSEAIDRHRKKLHAILEILIHMGGRRPVYIQVPLTKGFRSSLVSGKRTKPISN